MGERKNWSAIFLVYSSNVGAALDAPPNYDILKEIEKISPSAYCHVLVIHHHTVFEDDKMQKQATTVFELQSKGQKHLLPEAPVDQELLYNTEKLAVLFAWLNRHYPSEHRLLFTWGHGSVFGIFRRDELVQGYSKTLTGLLSNEMLAQAIQQGFGNVHVLTMLNCLMQNVHTCYALCTCVEYFVAPEASIVDPGYDYVGIVETLATSALVHPKLVAMQCVESMQQHYARWNWQWKFEQQAVFAIQLFKYPAYLDTFNKHIQRLTNFLKEQGTWAMRVDIRAAVNRCVMLDIKGYQLFDLINWARYLARFDFSNDALHALLYEMYMSLSCDFQPLVLARSIGKDCYIPPPHGWEIRENLSLQGIAIHLPSGILSAEKATDRHFKMQKAPYQSSFFANSPWLALFEELYKN